MLEVNVHAVDIITALSEQGSWDFNLVPVEILRKNKETHSLQKDGTLFPSILISKAHVSSMLNCDFNDYTGYVNYINIFNDPNGFPIGKLVPKQLPNELIKYIKFLYKLERGKIRDCFAILTSMCN